MRDQSVGDGVSAAIASPTQKRQDAVTRERRQARTAQGKTGDATANTALATGCPDDGAVQ